MAEQGVVLVTGGSGYIGGWCIARLLNDGWQVRTTIRDLSREGDVRRALAGVAPKQDGLSFRAADLTRDDGWSQAAEGCRYLLHVASPLGMDNPRDPEILVRPAREGAKRAIGAAIAAGVERVVMTTSVAAMRGGGKDGTYDETIWTNPNEKGATAYELSKTLAERAAWDLIRERGGKTSLATVGPVVVLGPVMGADYSGSLQVVSRLLTGSMPGVPNLGFTYVDVRDVADLHVRAMLAPQAAAERFIAASEFLWMREVAGILRQELGPKAAKVPTRHIPDLLVRVMALFDRPIGSVISALSHRREYSSAKARRVLDWQPRPAREAIVACAESLIAQGLA
jgi:nucleoside-diphosphate-sugar epimerase